MHCTGKREVKEEQYREKVENEEQKMNPQAWSNNSKHKDVQNYYYSGNTTTVKQCIPKNKENWLYSFNPLDNFYLFQTSEVTSHLLLWITD